MYLSGSTGLIAALTEKYDSCQAYMRKKLLCSTFVGGLIIHNGMHIFMPAAQVTMQTQILLSRGFDGYMPDIPLSKCILHVCSLT